jgi:hypothetical protein
MRIRSPLSLFIAAAVSFPLGYAGISRADDAAHPSPVPVYEANPFVGKSYDIVGRLWTGSWRSALRLPTYSKKDDAIASMQDEAARLNADALINLNCLDQRGSTWFPTDQPAFICYAVAIQHRQSQP